MRSLDSWLAAAAAEREQSGRVRYADARRNPQSTSGLLDLASNDYLGLAGDPRLAAAAIAATERFGTSSRASRVVTGTTAAHEELEAELCRLTGQPSALVFSSGYTANLAILTALGDPDTLLVCDRHIHASLIDGARLSRSPVEIAEHGDLDQVEIDPRAGARSRARSWSSSRSIRCSATPPTSRRSQPSAHASTHSWSSTRRTASALPGAAAARSGQRRSTGADHVVMTATTVQSARLPGRGGARAAAAARPSDQHRAELHLRHRPGTGRRCRSRRGLPCDRRFAHAGCGAALRRGTNRRRSRHRTGGQDLSNRSPSESPTSHTRPQRAFKLRASWSAASGHRASPTGSRVCASQPAQVSILPRPSMPQHSPPRWS